MRVLSLIVVLVLTSVPVMGQTVQRLGASDAGDEQWFGFSADVHLNWAVIGAVGDNSLTGAAYVYYYDGMDAPWVEWSKLNASDAQPGDQYGTSVAINNRVIVVGAPAEDEFAGGAGAVYVYRLVTEGGAQWIEEQKIIPPVGSDVREFGYDVDVRDNTLVIGARSDHQLATWAGAAYVYHFNGTTWEFEFKLLASDGAYLAGFGESVAIGSDRIAVGAATSNAQGESSGAAYVFVRQTEPTVRWVEEAILLPSDGMAGDQFGNAIDMSGDQVVVGAWFGTGGEAKSGAAYVFERSGETWSETAKLQASDGAPNDYFAKSVAIESQVLQYPVIAVGAPYRFGGSQYSAGAVYLFEMDGTDWLERKIMMSPSVDWQELYGWSVAAKGFTLMVGAMGNREQVVLGGVAYAYTNGLLSVDTEDFGIVTEYRLDQNYPNPFNPTTTIRYAVPAAGRVNLAVYDLLGHEVEMLVSGDRTAGVQEVQFDATGLASGVYVYRLQTGSYVESRSMLVLK